jgi:hypothetical protein
MKTNIVLKTISYIYLFAVIISAFFCIPGLTFAQTAEDLGVGTIAAPPGVDKYNAAAQAQGADIAIVYFMSNMIKLFTVVAGIWVILNGILAGYYFVQSSGDAGTYEKARNQITQSAIGLAMIVLSYMFTGLVGLLFFGDAGIFLNPRLK